MFKLPDIKIDDMAEGNLGRNSKTESQALNSQGSNSSCLSNSSSNDSSNIKFVGANSAFGKKFGKKPSAKRVWFQDFLKACNSLGYSDCPMDVVGECDEIR